MAIRIALLTVLMVGLGIYAWRDWFVALCGLILLMAFLEHPDMPKTIMGVQGLNPWNLMMADVLLAWLASRRREGLHWDMPIYINVLLLLYLGVIVAGFVRAVTDFGRLEGYTVGGMISEELINTIKWPIPGLMIFHGCRKRSRLGLALGCILGMYFLLALQVAKHISPSAAMSGGTLSALAGKVLLSNIGYHRVNLSMMLAGASWAMLSTLPLLRRPWQRVGVIAAALVTTYTQALTGGRMGYVAWGLVGLILCMVRWRKLLILIPLVVAGICVALPGVVERMMQGFGERNVAGQTYIDDAEVTSDRTVIWPDVIDKIGESPAVGFGRLAMKRTGLTDYLDRQYSQPFPHPHNAYLEWCLDNGIVGCLLVMPFYGVVLILAGRLFLRKDAVSSSIGGVTLSLVLALLVASMGSQTFYPREGSVGMWAAIGLMLRVWVEMRLAAPVGGRGTLAMAQAP